MKSERWERIGTVSALVLWFLGGYFALARAAEGAAGNRLATPIDAAIPFVSCSIYVYALAYPLVLAPAFVVRSPTLFRRIGLAHFSAITLALASFAVFPVTAAGLREDLAAIDSTRFDGWAVKQLYELDPPWNLFPSLHLALALISALGCWKARTAYGVPALIAVGLVAIAACTVKQHFVADVLAGAVLAVPIHVLLVGPYRPAGGEVVAWNWWGAAAWSAATSIAYVIAYASFRTNMISP